MKHYKGTTRHLTSNELVSSKFQFVIGIKHSIPPEQELVLEHCGFHTFTSLEHVTTLYPLKDSRYFEADVEDTISDGETYCSRHIMLTHELTFNEVMRLLNFNLDGTLLTPEQDQTNTGFLNYGTYNTGINNRGNSNRGNSNVGNNNKGNHNLGDYNQGNNNYGIANFGNNNSGNNNKGNSNVGNDKIGHDNQG
jgi:hypothetical protein